MSVTDTSQVVAFVDLDDTLFQSRRKCPRWATEEHLKPMAYGADGRALCFATPDQQTFLNWLLATATVIPVTARSSEVLARTEVPHQLAIVSNGGALLRNGEPCPKFAETMKSATQHLQEELDRLCGAILQHGDPEGTGVNKFRSWVVREQGVGLYVVAKKNSPEESLEDLRDWVVHTRALPSWWRVHLNDNNLAFIPAPVGKDYAVRNLMVELAGDSKSKLFIGVGDSNSDFSFMRLCDFAMMPKDSQVALTLTEALSE